VADLMVQPVSLHCQAKDACIFRITNMRILFFLIYFVSVHFHCLIL
jgi:hypothetical protein